MEDLQLNGPHPALTKHITADDPRYPELVNALSELREENRRLTEMDEQRTSLIACVSHELRTPLSHIMGYGSILLDGVLGELPSEQHSCLKKMMEGSEQLLRIVSDLLVFSRMESGRFEIQTALTNLSPLLDEVVRQMTPVFEANGLTLELRLTLPLPELWADADRLRQVLYNLLENAAKFTPKGGSITLSCRAEEQGIQLEVADTGIGIPPEHLEHIWDRFYQVPVPARQRRGAGLGLSIVKDIIEAHGGTVQVTSRTGEGTSFRLYLPSSDQTRP